MARILLITEELNSVVWTFAKSLHEQRQDILVVTSKNCDLAEVPPFEIWSPFQKWSAIEASRLVPKMLSWNPDIVHFFFTHEEERPRAAHWILSAVVSSLPGKTLAASYFAEGSVRSFTDRAFLRMFDMNTFGTRSQLMRIKRQKSLAPKTVAEVLPPLEDYVLKTDQSIRPNLTKLIRTLGPYVLIPEAPPANFDEILLAHHGFETLVLGENQRRRTKTYSTGSLNPNERDFVFKNASALILAECDLSVLELRRYHEISEKTGLPLVVTSYQNEILPGLCRNCRSGWVLERGLTGLEKVLEENPGLKLNVEYSAYSGHELMDNTLNELLRLYQRAFLTRWT